MAYFWFAFDIGAYESSTAHLTMLEDGAYNRLLRYYYKTGQPIPNDPAFLQRVTNSHTSDEIEAVAYVLKSFFKLKASGWHNKRANEELLKARRISKVRQSAAQEKNKRMRARRMADANNIGSHTDAEWTLLLNLCGCKCVKCGSEEDVCKDHITPIYLGGSNHISNLQPLCRKCNSAKGPATHDYRPPAIAQQMLGKAPAKVDTVTVTVTTTEPKSKAKATRAHFAVPSLGEVTAYCQERNQGVDPQKWFNYYTANGWKIGRNAMKDWRAAVRTWEKNGYERSNSNRPEPTQPNRPVSAQVARFHNNRAEVERAFGAAAVGGTTAADRAGQTPRLGARDTPALEGEITKL